MKFVRVNVLLFCICTMQLCAATVDNLNRCLVAKHHKKTPGAGDIKSCSPWSKRSCCSNKTAKSIEKDGMLTLYRMTWDHCNRTLSKACRDWFVKDTCFYECSPNVGPFIVTDKRSKKTRKQRMVSVPLCAKDCDAWFTACKDDFTCSDNWNKNWKWRKTTPINQCIQECKTFQEYFQDSRSFCNNIFDRSFEYTRGEPGQDCYSLWPNTTKEGYNPNEQVAKIAEKSRDNSAAVDEKLFKYMDRCLATIHHKRKPGPEYEISECVPWREHACCNSNTTSAIKQDGGLTLFNTEWNSCGELSEKCRAFFVKDACFYSCSPNLAPWIVPENVVQNTSRTEKIMDIPLCSDDCDAWFAACKDDRVCPDNWDEMYTWPKKGKKCTQSCKRFSDYFNNSMAFCRNRFFNHAFEYTVGKRGKDCMSLWPDHPIRNFNQEFAFRVAHKNIHSSAELCRPGFFLRMISFVLMFLCYLQ